MTSTFPVSPLTPPDSPRPTDRPALITLNACPTLSRDAICHLAQRDPPITGPPHGRQPDDPDPVSARDQRVARALLKHAGALAEAELERARLAGARVITRLDQDYPPQLLDLELPPPVLYLKGSLPRRPAIAIVGSRQADPYGREAGEMFGRDLAAAGLSVVSGMARGIDTCAHRGALATPCGKTVAVMGCGIDLAYPRRNRHLADRIRERGAVVSEFPVGTAPRPRNFPIRNRIIAGLAVATLVVQAAPRSGSLITARLALELGREVFAVPGLIFHPRALGTNTLLADGALLAQGARDVLEALPLGVRDRLTHPESTDTTTPDGAAGEILEALSLHQTLSPEELSRLLSLPIAEVLAPLVELEISGRVRRYPGPLFHLRR